MNTNYIVIAPARNESALIAYTITSVLQQTITPAEFIIVNDGSTDDTAECVRNYSKSYPWIKLVNRSDRGHQKYGGGVVEAFYEGLSHITTPDYDFIVKLDCDLSFDAYYFENLLREFHFDERLGIASGQTYFLNSQKQLIWEDAPLDHTRGPSKVYREACFESINGLVPTLGWDTIDEVSARMNGWKTRSFPEYKIIHHRALGSNGGFIKGNIRHGHTDYLTGYHVGFFVAKSVYRLFTKPYIAGSLASAYGFFKNYVTGTERAIDASFRRYYRREQLKKLVSRHFWQVYLEKYAVPWRLAVAFSFFLYYSGLVAVYLFLRKKVFRRYHGIVLTYHKIGHEYNSHIAVSPARFQAQIEFLCRTSDIVSLEELLNRIRSHTVTKDAVAITFDDGYADNYFNAYPVLHKKGLPATVFVISNQLERDGMLTKTQVAEMQQNGITIGSHTLNHPILSHITLPQAAAELADSKKSLEELFQKPIRYLAYPKGKNRHISNDIKSLAEATGYKACFTMNNDVLQAHKNLFALPRLGIRNYPLFVFKVRVSGILESRPVMFIRRKLALL